MCDCIEDIDTGLKPQGQCTDATMFSPRKATMMLLRTDKWKPENRRGKPSRIIATYCPFCGERYEPADAGRAALTEETGGERPGSEG